MPSTKTPALVCFHVWMCISGVQKAPNTKTHQCKPLLMNNKGYREGAEHEKTPNTGVLSCSACGSVNVGVLLCWAAWADCWCCVLSKVGWCSVPSILKCMAREILYYYQYTLKK